MTEWDKREEEFNLEANSKSLNEVYGRLNMGRLPDACSVFATDEAPFGLHKPPDVPFYGLHKSADAEFPDGAAPVLQKAPSEPDMSALTAPGTELPAQLAEANDDHGDDSCCSLFTCTVNRKATRAGYHLSDTNDVAFLIAKFARELRRAGND